MIHDADTAKAPYIALDRIAKLLEDAGYLDKDSTYEDLECVIRQFVREKDVLTGHFHAFPVCRPEE